MILSFSVIFLFFEERLSASDGFGLGVLSCLIYMSIILYVEKRMPEMRAEHDYIMIFDKLREKVNIDNLTSGEVLSELEKLFPKENPHKSIIGHIYFEKGSIFKATSKNLTQFKELGLSNFENQLSNYRTMIKEEKIFKL